MSAPDSTTSPYGLRDPMTFDPMGLASLALVTLLAYRAEAGGLIVAVCSAPHVVLRTSLIPGGESPACPNEGLPADRAVKVNVWRLLLIAAIVEKRRLHDVTVSRIGSLYGP